VKSDNSDSGWGFVYPNEWWCLNSSGNWSWINF
jgi:hypothetical protein